MSPRVIQLLSIFTCVYFVQCQNLY